jgi:hypothetical protein
VTIAVGRGRPVAIGGPKDGVQVGLEALCSVKYFDADLEDRFVHVIAHEYGHVQQDQYLADDEHPTVLVRSLVEGAAEFVSEMISGGVPIPLLVRPPSATKPKSKPLSYRMKTRLTSRNGSTTSR